MKRYVLKALSDKLLVVVVVLSQLALPAFALDQSTGPGGSNVQAVWDNGYTGQGVTVGLISQDHARLTHEAFSGIDSNNWFDATDQNNYVPSNHDTSVGGIICSRGGAAYPNHKGAAPGAELYSYKVVRPISESDPNLLIDTAWIQTALDEALNNGCTVIVTGIQLSSTANGNSIWSLMYDYYAYQYNLNFATAAGNYASAITIFGDTFNSITTGGLIVDVNNVYYQIGSPSNPGPTSDGRQKPDLAAPSEGQWTPRSGGDTSWGTATPGSGGQTSWAVPHTGGVAAVLLSYANSTSDTDDNQNVVIKAVIVNSAFPNIRDKTGTSTVDQLESEPDWPWNEDRGYGRLDAKRAYDTLISPKIVPGVSTGNPSGWAYDAVASGQQDNFTVSGLKNERLLVTLTWNRRVVWDDQQRGPGSGIIEEGELEGFLANLDLAIYDPDGLLISPVSSTVDNLEKVDLLLTKTGDYEIRVVNQSGSESANYGLAFELLPSLEADFNIDYVVDSSDLAHWAQFWLESGCIDSTSCDLYDLIDNDIIDLGDFSRFANQWLDFDSRYYSP